jgi:hypothetical protein
MVIIYFSGNFRLIIFTFNSKKFSLIGRRHHCQWRATNFRPMLVAQGLWVGSDLYCATPAVKRGLVFSGYIQMDCPIQLPLKTHMRMWMIYSNPDPHRWQLELFSGGIHCSILCTNLSSNLGTGQQLILCTISYLGWLVHVIFTSPLGTYWLVCFECYLTCWRIP